MEGQSAITHRCGYWPNEDGGGAGGSDPGRSGQRLSHEQTRTQRGLQTVRKRACVRTWREERMAGAAVDEGKKEEEGGLEITVRTAIFKQTCVLPG